MNLPTEFLTTESLYTLAGLSLVVFLVVEVVRVYLVRIENILPVKTVAALLGIALSVILAMARAGIATPDLIILAVANGAMAGLLATGGASVIAEASKLRRRDEDAGSGIAAVGADPVADFPQRTRWGAKW